MFQNRQRNRQHLGVMLLAGEMIRSGPIPPVTLLSILVQIGVYLGFVPSLSGNQTKNMCLNPARILAKGEWYRLLAPVIMHADDMHLYYNMASLLYKGRKLESRLGSPRFAVILSVFTIASTLMTVALSYTIDEVLHAEDYMYQCAVGFSGVLFALKVLMNHYCPDENQRLLGFFPIPAKYACWIELLIIQLITPNASFIGHMAGILVGLLYTAGPLKWLTSIITSAVSLAGLRSQNSHEPSAPPMEEDDYRSAYAGAFSGQGAATGRGSSERRNDRYRDYTAGLSEDEQMRQAMEESLRQRQAPSYGWRN